MALPFSFCCFSHICQRLNLSEQTCCNPPAENHSFIQHRSTNSSTMKEKRPVNSSPCDKLSILTSILENDCHSVLCQLLMPSYEQKLGHTQIDFLRHRSFSHIFPQSAHRPTEEPFNASLRDSLAVIYTSHHGDDEGFAPWFSPNADCSPTLPADLRNPDPDTRWQV